MIKGTKSIAEYAIRKWLNEKDPRRMRPSEVQGKKQITITPLL